MFSKTLSYIITIKRTFQKRAYKTPNATRTNRVISLLVIFTYHYIEVYLLAWVYRYIYLRLLNLMTPFKQRECVVFQKYYHYRTVTITINPIGFNLKLKTTVILIACIIIIVDGANTWCYLAGGTCSKI